MDNGILYKYLDVNGALAMLKQHNLQFTNACYFNDPFDCHPGLIDCSNTPNNSSDWPPAEFLVRKAETDLENMRDRTWISCLSKRFDNPLMWSYYTKHQGVCIGLNRELISHCISINFGMIVIRNGVDVEYKDILQKPDYFHSPLNVFQYQLCTKGKQWAHEEEVRYAIIDPSTHFVPYALNRKPKRNENIDWKEVRFYPRLRIECFHSLYLGCRMQEKEREKILSVCREIYPNMIIYEMKINSQRFKLDAIPIED